ncbi:lactate dehydrogenase [Tenacibaculum finnmarkense genomovar ulcerans]|uniref:class I SAM-dependent DNA methyltransferase n=1 Tax=Tenacibaculum finnmarkense TaxID=2781243 RepID=UPI001E4BFBF8|nr:DNA methyltransferase [Tenacibaculum finnmarkense]MCD8428628.1 lactate dehydrogenase [Tenacibaculum finnmarkense genomovar ulcerans]
MNAVEIEEAVSELALQPFEAKEFPFSFLEAFGNKSTTIKKLKSGSSNKSDIDDAILQRNNIHIATSKKGKVSEALEILRKSPATKKSKAEYILATDGLDFQAENIFSGETVACEYKDFHNYFGFFLSLANITTVKQIRESAFDIKATSRLNKLYVELLEHNPDWASVERRHDMNHFLARLIFCFFAEDTDIFKEDDLFTDTVQKISDSNASNTHDVIDEIFRAMDTKLENRDEQKIKVWGKKFPYVNGQLFSGSTEVPKFTKIARSYLLHVGSLDWKQINPDIFGSMIQAVADEDERGSLGMHYTSVPNIRKVLNPLFLDDLREQLEKAEDNSRKLLNLRNRMARIRVFDPACGSGNFLVIAYKDMRKIENEINIKRGEKNKASEIPLTNFRGIELKDFSAEVARLALIIAEYQCDVLYRGQSLALAEFLPLDAQNWITKGNALRIDWFSVCPPTGTGVKLQGDDLFSTPLNQAEIDFDNEGGETYICGNPPFSGSRKQTNEQKSDLELVFKNYIKNYRRIDYVGAWFFKAALYSTKTNSRFALVATNSICQGQQVALTWAAIFKLGFKIRFAYTSFNWSNLASNKAGVTVVIVGLDNDDSGARAIYDSDNKKEVDFINPYLLPNKVEIISASKKSIFTDVDMSLGVYYSKSAGLILTKDEKNQLIESGVPLKFIKRFLGSNEFIKGLERYCLWISKDELDEAIAHPLILERINSVKKDRLETKDKAVNKLALKSHQFREYRGTEKFKIFVPIISSENREYFPAGIADDSIIPTNKAFYMPNAPLWALSIVVSKLHLIWIGSICGRMRMDYSYSSTLGWNTFPISPLTQKNKEDLTDCAEEILIARERHFPATIADLYEPDKMPEDLRLAHQRNDEVLERIYIGRKFKNDTERLEKLFQLYTKMTSKK